MSVIAFDAQNFEGQGWRSRSPEGQTSKLEKVANYSQFLSDHLQTWWICSITIGAQLISFNKRSALTFMVSAYGQSWPSWRSFWNRRLTISSSTPNWSPRIVFYRNIKISSLWRHWMTTWQKNWFYLLFFLEILTRTVDHSVRAIVPKLDMYTRERNSFRRAKLRRSRTKVKVTRRSNIKIRKSCKFFTVCIRSSPNLVDMYYNDRRSAD